MREFTRFLLQFLMVGILLAGCVHNICHFEKLTENNTSNRYYPNRYGNRYYNTNSSTREQEPYVEEDDVEEVVITHNSNNSDGYIY